MAEMSQLINSKVAQYEELDKKKANIEVEYNPTFIKSQSKKKALSRDGKIKNTKDIKE